MLQFLAGIKVSYFIVLKVELNLTYFEVLKKSTSNLNSYHMVPLQTILLIPCIPHGVLQLGSLEMVRV